LEAQGISIEQQKNRFKDTSEMREQVFDQFSDKIFSPEGVVVGGKKWTLEYVE